MNYGATYGAIKVNIAIIKPIYKVFNGILLVRLRAPSFLFINQKLKENLSNPSTASLGFIN